MQIDVGKVEEGGGQFAQTYRADELAFDDTELRLLEPVEIHGRIRRTDSQVQMQGELHTRVAMPCSRCLKPVEFPIDAELSERFVPAVSWRNDEQHELSSEDLDLAVFDGEQINLDDLVKEEIFLALPGHVLCREDCQGLCPTCGIDRNIDACGCDRQTIDARWEKLRNLQF